MSILINQNTYSICQGFTGKQGTLHSIECIKYGTKIVAGISPKKKIKKHLDLPVYNTISEAIENFNNINCSVIYVPAQFCKDSILEAIHANIKLIVCITEGIPILDMLFIKSYLKYVNSRNKEPIRFIGPNCPGIITPDESKIGIMPGKIHCPGIVGIVSRSGTLTYEAVYQTTKLGLGQSSCVGIGGDPILGSSFIDILELFENDPQTKAIVMIGEIGGNKEEKAAEFIKNNIKKPVIAYIAGLTAPEGKRMGHAGAIISQGEGTALGKLEKLKSCGVTIVKSASQIGITVKKKLDNILI